MTGSRDRPAMTSGLLGHRGVVALGQDLAARQHGDGVGQRRRRPTGCARPSAPCGPAATCLISADDAVDVLVRHAGGRLVEQHHLRVERQRGGDLQRALAAIGQLAGRAVGELGEADSLEQLAARARRARRSSVARSARSRRSRRACAAARRARSRARVRCGNTAEIWNERTRPMPRDRGRARCR